MEEKLKRHSQFLVDRVDPDFGLLDKSLANKILTREALHKIKLKDNTVEDRNRILLDYILKNKKAEEWIAALKDSGQTHLANYINADGVYQCSFEDDWPLSESDTSQLDFNCESLLELLDTTDLCFKLIAEGVINNRQKQFICSKTTDAEKNEALLDILIKCSRRQYKRTIVCLNDSNQSHVAKLLSYGGGVAVRVHAHIEGALRNVDELEEEIISKLTRVLEQHPLEEATRLLELTHLRIIAARKGHSIVIYIHCTASNELLQLMDLLKTNQLKDIVLKLFMELLTIEYALRVRLTWALKELESAAKYFELEYPYDLPSDGTSHSKADKEERPPKLSSVGDSVDIARHGEAKGERTFNMAENSSPGPIDQLWYFAQRLVETAKSSSSTHEEHFQRIEAKFSQLVSHLSCLGDIIAAMYEKKKLTLAELEEIQHLQSTPIRANEELLSIVASKPRDVYDCFLSLLKDTNQPHLYQMLVSDDEKHCQRIEAKFSQLVSHLSCLGEIVAAMYQKEKLALAELEEIQHLLSTPIRANEELLSIVASKPRDVYDCFLSLLKDTNQPHLYQMLVSDDDTCDKAKGADALDHENLIRRNFMWLSEKLDTENGLNSLLFQRHVLTAREKEIIIGMDSSFQKNESLLSNKSPEDFETFLKMLEESGQGHLAKKLRKSRGSLVDSAVESAGSTAIKTDYELPPKQPQRSQQKPVPIRLFTKPEPVAPFSKPKPVPSRPFSRPVLLATPLSPSEPKPRPGRSLSTPDPPRMPIGSPPTSVQRTVKSNAENEVKYQREPIQGATFQVRLKNFESHLQADVTMKTASVIVFCSDKLEDSLKMCFQSLLQECRQMRKELFARNDKKNTELHELPKIASQFSAAAGMIEMLQRQMNSLHGQLTSERLQTNKVRMQTEAKIDELKTQIQTEKGKCKPAQYEKDKQQYTVVMNLGKRSLGNDQLSKLQEELDIEKHRTLQLEEKLRNATEQLQQLRRIDLSYVSKESQVIGINHQFLLENIKSSRLIELLRTKNCITDAERDHLIQQPDNFHKNDALLQWMRTIQFKESKGQKVLECFYQTDQRYVADLLKKGGVFIKSKISTKLVKEALFPKSSSKNAEKLKVKEAAAVNRLNQPQGLLLSSGQIITSEIPNDDIIIAPCCHQETEGIVVWFWCQSRKEQRRLQQMYESGILIKKLAAIFKEFSSESVASPSKYLLPTLITMFESDFTTNGNNDIRLSREERTSLDESPYGQMPAIHGLAVLGHEAFISRLQQPDIEVYDSATLRFKRRMEVKGMNHPENIVSCSANNCLYTFDWDFQNEFNAILRIDPLDGKLIKTWTISGRGGRLSVASDTNVILNINYAAVLHEYTANGNLIRKINLDSVRTGIFRSWHAVKLDSGLFVVCHGGYDDPLIRVCLLLTTARNAAVGRIDEVEILKEFSSAGDQNNRLVRPIYLSVDKEGSILVSDKNTMLLSSALDKPQIIVSEDDGLRSCRTCFDQSTGQWFVADRYRIMVCRVRNEQVERHLYNLINN